MEEKTQSRCIDLSYVVTEGTQGRLGVIVETGTPVFLYNYEADKSQVVCALEMTHQHYLKCMMVDFKNSVLIHLRYTQTIEEHIKDLQNGGFYSKMTYTFPSISTEVEDHRTYEYMPPQFTRIIKGMIEFIRYVHSKSKSLSYFDEKNLYVESGEIKIAGVHFDVATPENMKSDYTQACWVICSFYTNRDVSELPPLLKNLHDLMQKFKKQSQPLKKFSNEDFFVNHLALMSHSHRVIFVKTCDNKLKEIDVKKRLNYISVIEAAGNGVHNDWTGRILNDEVGFGPVALCLQQWEDDQHRAKQKNPQLNCPSQKRRGKQSLVRFGRNMESHLRDSSGQYNKRLIGIIDTDLMIMGTFDDYYLSLQEKMLGKGWLENILQDVNLF